jgi:hypothetical protein
MTYSRKWYWLAMGVLLAVVAVFVVLIPRPHPAVMAMPVMAACFGGGFLAYFSLDEIQRQNEMRALYYGGQLAVLFVLMPFVLLVSNALLETMAGLLPHASPRAPDMPHSPRTYFGMGAAMTLVVQAIGYFIAHAIFKVAGRARG